MDAENGEPLADVQVVMTGTGGANSFLTPASTTSLPPHAMTDSQGHFAMESNVVGRMRVIPNKAGYVFVRAGDSHAPAEPGVWVQVTLGVQIRNLELRMAKPGVVSGRVLDSNGNPIVGSRGSVTLQVYTYGTNGKRQLGWVPGVTYPGAAGSFQRMNDKGEFRFYDLPPGEYYLSVNGSGGAIGASGFYFYPGTREESKAIPIRVVGDEINIGTLNLPPPQPGSAVYLHATNAPDSAVERRVFIADYMLSTPGGPQPGELRIASVSYGHYDVVISMFLGNRDLWYAFTSLDVGTTTLESSFTLQHGPAIRGTLLLEDQSGNRTQMADVRCRVRSNYGLVDCSNSRVVPGKHELELDGLSPDFYVLSAKANDHDVLAEGLDIQSDTDLEIVFGQNGGFAQGTVRNSSGDTVPGAVVALVPNLPRRQTSLLFQNVVTDRDGKFEFRGIAPGSYKLFSWTQLTGAGYRNADFMKDFDARGTPVQFENGSRLTVNLVVFASEN